MNFRKSLLTRSEIKDVCVCICCPSLKSFLLGMESLLGVRGWAKVRARSVHTMNQGCSKQGLAGSVCNQLEPVYHTNQEAGQVVLFL